MVWGSDGFAYVGDGAGQVWRLREEGDAELFGPSLAAAGDKGRRIYTLDTEPQGKVAAALAAGDVVVLDSRGNVIARKNGHGSEVNDVAFDAAGARLFSAGDDGTVRSWDATTFRALWRAPAL